MSHQLVSFHFYIISKNELINFKFLYTSFQLDLDSIWTFVFGVPASQCATTISGRVSLCPEAAIAILTMVRAMLNQEDKGSVLFLLHPCTNLDLSLPLCIVNHFSSPFLSNSFYCQIFVCKDHLSPLSDLFISVGCLAHCTLSGLPSTLHTFRALDLEFPVRAFPSFTLFC